MIRYRLWATDARTVTSVSDCLAQGLLRGYLHADGSVGESRGAITFTTSDAAKEFLRTLNIPEGTGVHFGKITAYLVERV